MKTKKKFTFLTDEELQQKAAKMVEPLRGKTKEKVIWRSGDEEEVHVTTPGFASMRVIRRVEHGKKIHPKK